MFWRIAKQGSLLWEVGFVSEGDARTKIAVLRHTRNRVPDSSLSHGELLPHVLEGAGEALSNAFHTARMNRLLILSA
jgi:hypothetical protein